MQTPASRGLFAAKTTDPDWRMAHHILLPAFSTDAMRGYFSQMLDVAVQLMQKWERLNPDDEIQVTVDTTRLTLDTIGLCGFGYRFNSFYRERPHPFVEAMTRCLTTGLERSSQPPIAGRINAPSARAGCPQPGNPPAGTSLSVTANTSTSRIASQKLGTATPT